MLSEDCKKNFKASRNDRSSLLEESIRKMFLRYGQEIVPVPSTSFIFERVLPPEQGKRYLTPKKMAERIDHPEAFPSLSRWLHSSSSVLIVVSDSTRKTGVSTYFPILMDRIISAGISPENISFIFATGIHRKVTEDEKKLILGEEIFSRFRIIDHDPTQDSHLKYLGKTKHGTEIKVNGSLGMFSRIILTGVVQFHYHAGFTGGRKSIIPGLASHETAACNHRLSLTEEGLRNPRSVAGRLEGNPVHEDMLEGALRIPTPFIINTVVGDQERVEAIFTGDMVRAHEKATQYLMETRIIRIKGRAICVLAGCGGYPKDINFIQAHKCIENCSHLVKDEGVLIVLAECSDGFGGSDFLEWFSMSRDGMRSEMKRGSRAYGQTALSLLKTLERIRIIMVSRLDQEKISRTGIVPASSLQEALQKAERWISSGKSGYIVEDGTQYLFRIG